MSYRKNNYKYNKNNYYNYSSVAHDYTSYQDNKPTKSNKRIKKVKKEKYVKVEEGLKIFSLKFFVTFIMLATFIVCIIFVEALIVQKRFEIDSLNIALKEITENNKNLETELAKNLDLEYVEYIASSELDMQKPASHQIVYIDIPKESYSEKSNTKDTESFLTKFLNVLKNKVN
ncbi:hypothetical protein [[Clostridium] colinum]|uniref:hypothetical protein n=1 Tax=[Clostridium] colinum TaxID=36835 RepID=UPI002023C33E|nr:hypothetical protein [[Clostridium] colinum]